MCLQDEADYASDIYYQDPDLFRSQRVVDEIVDDIAFTFGVRRGTLNVVSFIVSLIRDSRD